MSSAYEATATQLLSVRHDNNPRQDWLSDFQVFDNLKRLKDDEDIR